MKHLLFSSLSLQENLNWVQNLFSSSSLHIIDIQHKVNATGHGTEYTTIVRYQC